jgi:hypothetical protein
MQLCAVMQLWWLDILSSCMQVRELLMAAPSLVDVAVAPNTHITVCGDVHGQFYDLLHIFELNGLPSEDNPYVFNGAHSVLDLHG